MKKALVIAALLAFAAAGDDSEDTTTKDDTTTTKDDTDTTKKDTTKKDTTAAAKCALTKFEIFSDDKCTKADDTVKADDLKGAFKEAACADAAGKSAKTTCDGTGISTQKYKKVGCKDADKDGDATFVLKWGECTKTTTGKWVKVTGAKALMASAAVALAFVGSQF